MQFDLIGDIHGHAGALESLLERMGYRIYGGVYGHPESRAVFLGDFVDRGPRIRETLGVVRAMVEKGAAVSVLGNHEYNAICFNIKKDDEPHRWLRSRTDQHLYQHLETIYQFRNNRNQWSEYLRWFRTLPLFLDLGPIRVVHAAWYEPSLEVLRRYANSDITLNDALIKPATRRGTAEFDAIQNVLKGVELALPGAKLFIDKDGIERTEMRVRWWLPARGRTYREIAMPSRDDIDNTPVTSADALRLPGYTDEVPVFIGHYWLADEIPAVLSPHVACLDYSIARGGFLAAYRWSGESILEDDRFVIHEG